MYFNKIRHPANFVFNTASSSDGRAITLAGKPCGLAIDSLGSDVHRVVLTHSRWAPHGSDAELASEIPGNNCYRLKVDERGDLSVIESATQRVVLRGARQCTFGVSGAAWIMQFHHEPGMQFYGLGEHSKGLEKSGQRVKFWNTDVFGDFSQHEVRHGHANPMYMAMPYVIVKQGNDYIGLLINNPGATFMDLASDFLWDGVNPADRQRQSFYVGAPEGQPELYVIIGPSLAELTRKLQTLVGRVPLPPVWALGYQQCRWGYAGPKDLWALDRNFRKHGIPCDGLWLDIDYMERYKVFTFSEKLWRGRQATQRVLAKLAQRGRRIVPILDPGVGVEKGYHAYDSGLKHGIFCQTPEGEPFVGFVWPGRTHFPDFSLPEGRAWWAEQVKKFAAAGVSGAWLDMNDPSIGSVELDEMRFARGTKPHEAYHNQYALGMAKASRAGFLAAQPDQRPFLLTRSAYLSSSRYSAAWTGDNYSNWHHLQMVIPVSLGLALSGMPFNGPDVGGFIGDTTPELAVAWHKVCFLFPFIRNHSMFNSRRQEPWALGATAQRTISHYIRLRYKLLPYLYQQFVEQEASGAAILRPLFHDFADTEKLPLGKIADQFLIGPDILQAPVIEEKKTSRRVLLPGKARWFSASEGVWRRGGSTITVKTSTGGTPLFVREGALLPMQKGERRDNRNDFATIELHVFLRGDSRGAHRGSYVFDDGESFAYQKGQRSRVEWSCAVATDGALEVTIERFEQGFASLKLCVVAYDAFTSVRFSDRGKSRTLPLGVARETLTGKSLRVGRTSWCSVRA
ncbi:glycoside hydrolase family 31 protein [Oleiharenicola lentus]|uniref:glycoside hydrolase family 31 protein n=1 Tax=Oleiharenicola lentus TaxID=2508720 RepID=UPI003F67E69F